MPDEKRGTQLCSVKKVFLKISHNSQENTCTRVSFLIKETEACNFIKRETMAQVFSCEICEIFKKFKKFLRTLPVTDSEKAQKFS